MQQRDRITEENPSYLLLQKEYAFTDTNKEEEMDPPPGEDGAISFTNPDI